ncbi:MAG: hypothetical protein WC876_04655 [Candidatus Thermoplasmatota archaeon]|jgi:hypothetical protein
MPEPEGLDEAATERRNITRLIRVMSMFVAWPSLTAGLAFIVFEGVDVHLLHIVTLLPIGVAALLAFVMAPRLTERFMQA